MAKITSPITFTGKVGPIVGAKNPNGGYQLRPHVTEVANPRTVAQTMQRAKINLAGRFSSFTPKEVLYGFRGNATKRRSAFMKNLINNTQSSQEDAGTIKASIIKNKVKFSEGTAASPITATVTLSIQTQQVSVSLNGLDIDERVIIVGVFKGANDITGISSVLATTNAAVLLDWPTNVAPTEVDIYAVPITVAEGDASWSYSALGSATDITYSAVAAALQSSMNVYHATQFVGTTSFED